ncbi:Tim44-like domain-containing protein [Ramlibacter sp. 2FC]|uniref:Tim44 domain-containing protein n=1 Tax=Ramlibacter sp. 2FC TaxID=2502188 RepID=UPI0010F83365|nr:Tim44-like domain-containing protein [Ramlibacter sp. 2FC]
MKKILSLVLVAMLAVASLDAEAARRLGGGKSIGQQSSNVTQREATKAPAAPTTTTQAASPTAQPATAATAAGAAAPAARKPWGAMLGGLAAGLGLAWLAHSLGLGEAFGQFLLMGLLALVVMAVIGAVMRARKGTPRTEGGLAFQGAGNAPAVPSLPRQYSPDKVGNDASARPWESNATPFDASAASGGSMIGSALAGAQAWGTPEGFDVAGFLGAAKRNFVTLQDAWDRSDIATLRSMMTDTMVGEIRAQLAERESHAPGQPNKTEVVMLEAQLLGIEELPDHYMASVEFNGMIREEPSAGPSPFREVWNMTKPRSGASGWLVAGVQALQ